MNTTRPFYRQALIAPELPALIFGDATITYGELRSFAGTVAQRLHAAGLRAGDRVALLHANAAQLIIASIGCATLGAAALPLLPGASAERATAHCRRVGVSASITAGKGGAESLEQTWLADSRRFQMADLLKPPPKGSHLPLVTMVDDQLWRIGFSSGTTGQPKAIGWTHRASMINSLQMQSMYASGPGEILLLGMSVNLFFAINYWIRMLHTGGCVILPADSSPDTLLTSAIRHKPTQMITSGYIANQLAAHLQAKLPGSDRVVPSLKILCTGGGAMPSDAQAILRTRLASNFYNQYGSSEAGFLARTDPKMQAEAPHMTGRLAPWVDAEVLDDEGRRVAPGVVGKLRFRGPSMAEGYLGDEELNRKHFKDGWFYPGDLGSISLAGDLQVAGREDHRLNLGGHKVDPLLIENVINEHPQVLECAVIKAQLADFNDALVALVVTRDGVPVEGIQAALIEACTKKMGPLNTPRAYVRAGGLPRNENGKILRDRLKVEKRPVASAPS